MPEAPLQGEGYCQIMLRSPKEYSLPLGSIAPQIKVSRLYFHGTPGEMQPPDYLKDSNQNGMRFGKTETGYEFWIGDSVVHIELLSFDEKYGFSRDLFFQTVIESFRLINISMEQALDIARKDALASKVDFSKYTVQTELKQDGWLVYYISKDYLRGGGGPEYIIDAQTGNITSKKNAR